LIGKDCHGSCFAALSREINSFEARAPLVTRDGIVLSSHHESYKLLPSPLVAAFHHHGAMSDANSLPNDDIYAPLMTTEFARAVPLANSSGSSVVAPPVSTAAIAVPPANSSDLRSISTTLVAGFPRSHGSGAVPRTTLVGASS
jgi:hypothetical protein